MTLNLNLLRDVSDFYGHDIRRFLLLSGMMAVSRSKFNDDASPWFSASDVLVDLSNSDLKKHEIK